VRDGRRTLKERREKGRKNRCEGMGRGRRRNKQETPSHHKNTHSDQALF
jgi:hypothetical protein